VTPPRNPSAWETATAALLILALILFGLALADLAGEIFR
jgi:hypothetical protein